MSQHLIDEFAAKVANTAVAQLSPEVGVAFREDPIDGAIVQISLCFTQCVRISREAVLFERRGADTAALLGEDLALRMKEGIVKYASTVCLKSGKTV